MPGIRKATGLVKTVIAAAAVLLLGIGFSLKLSAQDVIKLKEGTELKVTIVEENTAVIKYREYDNPTGPLYSVRKDLVESVRYKRGNKGLQPRQENAVTNESLFQSDTARYLTVRKGLTDIVLLNGRNQAPGRVRSLMEDTPEALALYDSGRKMYNGGYDCIVSTLLVDIVAELFGNHLSNTGRKVTAIALLGADGGLIAGGIILSIEGRQKVKRSVGLYNSSLTRPLSFRMDIGMQEDGFGLGIKF
ncbi:MAG: hypothetical protein ABSG89_08410 [Bacteroidales bacterium]